MSFLGSVARVSDRPDWRKPPIRAGVGREDGWRPRGARLWLGWSAARPGEQRGRAASGELTLMSVGNEGPCLGFADTGKQETTTWWYGVPMFPCCLELVYQNEGTFSFNVRPLCFGMATLFLLCVELAHLVMKAVTWSERPCCACRRLESELEAVKRASEDRARHDHDRCLELVAHIERLVRTNQALLNDERPSQRHGKSVENDEREARAREDERVRRLQVIVMDQAKELEKLRARADSGRLSSRRQLPLSTTNQQEGEEEEGPHAAVLLSSRSTRKTASTVSLLAHVESKNRRIHELETAVDKMTARLDRISSRKLCSMKESQQVIARLELQVRKYEAYSGKHREEVEGFERKLAAARSYIEVLERRLASNVSRQISESLSRFS